MYFIKQSCANCAYAIHAIVGPAGGSLSALPDLLAAIGGTGGRVGEGRVEGRGRRKEGERTEKEGKEGKWEGKKKWEGKRRGIASSLFNFWEQARPLLCNKSTLSNRELQLSVVYIRSSTYFLIQST